jgi:hypothetical protein
MIERLRIRGYILCRHIDMLAFDSFPIVNTKDSSPLASRGKSKEVRRLRLIGAGQKG